MSLLTYTYSLKANGAVIAEIDCEVDCFVYLSGGEPDIEFHDVRVVGLMRDGSETRTNLTQSDDPALKAIGLSILSELEDDDDLFAEACDRAGIHWSGRGGNDPEGQWRAA